MKERLRTIKKSVGLFCGKFPSNNTALPKLHFFLHASHLFNYSGTSLESPILERSFSAQPRSSDAAEFRNVVRWLCSTCCYHGRTNCLDVETVDFSSESSYVSVRGTPLLDQLWRDSDRNGNDNNTVLLEEAAGSTVWWWLDYFR